MAGQAAVLTMVRCLSRLAPSSSSTPHQRSGNYGGPSRGLSGWVHPESQSVVACGSAQCHVYGILWRKYWCLHCVSDHECRVWQAAGTQGGSLLPPSTERAHACLGLAQLHQKSSLRQVRDAL